jgi:hypothetical protein
MDWDQIIQTMNLKGSPKLIERFTEILNESIANDTSLFESGSLSADTEQFDELVGHAEQLWRDATTLLDAQSYATSIALSIAAVEEIGKISFARFLLPINARRRELNLNSNRPSHHWWNERPRDNKSMPFRILPYWKGTACSHPEHRS